MIRVDMGLPDHNHGPLRALDAVLGSIESVRNGRALYLLLCTFALAGLAWSGLRGRLGGADSPALIALWLAATGFIVFYGSFAAGIVLMDEARGLPPHRTPLQALGAALMGGHRLLLTVLGVLAVAAVPLALVGATLWAARWLPVQSLAVSAAVALGVPATGLVVLVLATLVGPLAAPAAWLGWPVRRTLGFVARQVRERLVHAVMLSAAVSLLSAGIGALVSFVVVIGARLVLGVATTVFNLPLQADPLLAAMLGLGFRLRPGADPITPLTQSGLDAAALVFAFGLVIPGVVYLRGLCELFLALRRQDEASALVAGPTAPAAAGTLGVLGPEAPSGVSRPSPEAGDPAHGL